MEGVQAAVAAEEIMLQQVPLDPEVALLKSKIIHKRIKHHKFSKKTVSSGCDIVLPLFSLVSKK